MTAPKTFLSIVLLVEDDKVTNMMHTRLISRSGLVGEVDIATDGLVALEYLENRRLQKLPMPELILLDINMPRMDGFEFLQEYARIAAQLAPARPMIVMVSTSLLRADQDRAEADQNVYRFIGKPIAIGDITELVEAYPMFAAG